MSSKDRNRRPSGASGAPRNRDKESQGATTSRAQTRANRRLAQQQAAPSGLARLSAVNPLVLWTSIAGVVAVVVIVAALVVTSLGSGTGDYKRPTAVTPENIPASGQILGSPSAPVKLDLYSDFRCTGCGAFYRSIEPKLVDNFVAPGKLRIFYRDFTLIDKFDKAHASQDAANAGLCAADENKFWPYHDWLFTNQSPQEEPSAFTKDRLIGIARAAGIDNATFEACVRNGTHDKDVTAAMASAPSGIDATPTLFVNGKVVVSSQGPSYLPTYDDIANAINAAASGSTGS